MGSFGLTVCDPALTGFSSGNVHAIAAQVLANAIGIGALPFVLSLIGSRFLTAGHVALWPVRPLSRFFA
ncbi:MAG: hypothetical protein V2I40_04045 [Desulfobacteraceae bacterium]|jgi:hypothetical protein|nr:hypothetical protein [Desulfobacteraceae bacterium]